MEKTANIYVRIEPEIKSKAEEILFSLGLNPSTAINMFYKQIIIQNGLPFEVKMSSIPVNVDNMSDEELKRRIESGLLAAKNGEGNNADEVFASIKKDFNL